MYSANSNKLLCPICEAMIGVDSKVLAGELVRCHDCGSDLEVVANDKQFNLTVAPEIQEDWGE